MNVITRLLQKSLLRFSTYAMLGASMLSGCANLNSSFDCRMKPGIMCKNLDQVNRLVDQGKIGNAQETDVEKKNGAFSAVSFQRFQRKDDFTTPYPDFGLKYGDPVRYGETVLRVWLAPYEDKDGNYYQPATLYTVVKKGHWIGAPVKAINPDGEKV